MGLIGVTIDVAQTRDSCADCGRHRDVGGVGGYIDTDNKDPTRATMFHQDRKGHDDVAADHSGDWYVLIGLKHD